MSGSLNSVPVATEGLLGPGDGPAVTLQNEGSEIPLVLVCDHASPLIPKALNNLGLGPRELDLHIALDIGAAAVTRHVADLLGLCAVYCGYSRLVVDVNRYLADPSSFNETSDGVVVPGNQQLSEAAKNDRVTEIREPYHAAIELALNQRSSETQMCGIVAIHSFTPYMNGFARPWQVGVLWDQDPRFAGPLLDHFRADEHMCVGDNQPYSGKHPADYTVDHHGERQGRPCASLEIRQDLLLDKDAQVLWAERVAEGLRDLLKQPELFVKWGLLNGESEGR
ncbi:MAG: N-formylglutamate amidohydrolase [Gammaproteobacteria bacterium]